MAENPMISGPFRTLFSPLTVKSVELRNRIVMPPMVTVMEPGSAQYHEWYLARAKGGCGLVIWEATPIRKLADPVFADLIKPTVDAVRAEGVGAAIQIFERGHNSAGEPIWASDKGDARAATDDELLELVELYAQAAAQCRRIGFDGVEPHGAHGFFLNRFFTATDNRREDAFGGSLERRAEFGLRIVRAIRAAVDEECLLLYRHTSEADGYTLEDSRWFVKQLEAAGVDVLDVSPSNRGADEPRAVLAGEMKREVGIPVIAVGGFDDVASAEEVLASGRADLIAIGRALIADGELPNKVREGRTAEIIECVLCDEFCYGNLRRGEPIGCTQNPDSGNEYRR